MQENTSDMFYKKYAIQKRESTLVVFFRWIKVVWPIFTWGRFGGQVSGNLDRPFRVRGIWGRRKSSAAPRSARGLS